MKVLQILVLLVGASLLAFLIRKTGLQQVVENLGKANFFYVFLGVVFYTVALLLRAYKWKILLETVDHRSITMRQFLPVYIFNSLIGHLTPARSGECMGPILFKKYFGSALGKGASVVIFDTMLELFVLIVGALFGFTYYVSHYEIGGEIGQKIYYIVGVLLVFVAVTLLFLYQRQKVAKVFYVVESHYISRVRFSAVIGSIKEEYRNFLYALKKIKFGKVLAVLLPLTVGAWLFSIARLYFLLSAVAEYEVLHVVVTFFLVAAVSVLFFVPFGIGVGEFGWMYFLGLEGYLTAPILAGMLLDRIFLISTILIYSGISVSVLSKRAPL